MRHFTAVTLLSLMLVSTADAKLNPAFSERVAQAGDLVALDLGEGSEQFLGPLRIYLVQLEVADHVQGEDDSRLVKIGELGKPGEFGTPRVLTFEVPDLPVGEYTAAIWFKGYETGKWVNALEGIHPLLTIGAAAGGADEGVAAAPGSDERSWRLYWAIALAVGCLLAGFLGLSWRHASRRPASGTSAS